ncbi:Uncharacterized protein conserved in bacteria [Pragia fontium]|uniref:MmcQ/YjbR family DNA-binding protein n=1 Tax=Pragia fontium TaxID=82985 RepID=A0ABQ5LLQ4_9GAMM|nr:MmcQ/YjbR family DNA-binding protein [Pragia fontium]GKX64144.1 hypothetical protein SOASR032_27130 [Pragia fontium]SUB83786.1 Uncharacterized protein conserved in bacteria [Pragia fontium]
MDKESLIEYCLTKLGTEHDYQPLWGAERVKVSGKIFAIFSELDGRPCMALKCPPELAEQMRTKYKEVIPGYHLNKALWNTLFLDGALEQAFLHQMIDVSYHEVLSKLPKRTQQILAKNTSLD